MLLATLKSASLPTNYLKNSVCVLRSKNFRKCIEKTVTGNPKVPCYIVNQRFICGSLTRYNNYYDTLGVERSADKEAIKEAYIKLSKVYHPDKLMKGFGGQETNKFLQIREAFDVLSSDSRRLDYDMKTFGRSYDVNRFVTGEYKLNRQQFDNHEPFHMDRSNKRTPGKKKPPEENDTPSEEDRALLRQLSSLLPRVYAAVFILGLTIYFLGRRNRKDENKDQESHETKL